MQHPKGEIDAAQAALKLADLDRAASCARLQCNVLCGSRRNNAAVRNPRQPFTNDHSRYCIWYRKAFRLHPKC
jgi:hypothetical protein